MLRLTRLPAQTRSCVEGLTDALCLFEALCSATSEGGSSDSTCPWKLRGQLKAWGNSFPVGLGRTTCAGSLGPIPDPCWLAGDVTPLLWPGAHFQLSRRLQSQDPW